MNKSKLLLKISIIIIFHVLFITCIYSNNKACIKIQCNDIDKELCEKINNIITSQIKKNRYQITNNKKECSIIFLANINRYNKLLFIELKKQDKNGNTIFTEKIYLKNTNDLEIQVTKLVLSAIKNERLKKTKEQSINKKTDNNNKKTKKYDIGRILMSFDFMIFQTIGLKTSNQNGALGLKLIYDYKHIHVDVFGYTNIFSVLLYGVNLHYLFYDSNITPYIGLGFAHGGIGVNSTKENHCTYSMAFGDDSFYRNIGFFVPASLGIEFFRSYNIQLILEIGAFIPLQSWERSYQIDEYKSDCVDRKFDNFSAPFYTTIAIAITLWDDDGLCGCFPLYD